MLAALPRSGAHHGADAVSKGDNKQDDEKDGHTFSLQEFVDVDAGMLVGGIVAFGTPESAVRHEPRRLLFTTERHRHLGTADSSNNTGDLPALADEHIQHVLLRVTRALEQRQEGQLLLVGLLEDKLVEGFGKMDHGSTFIIVETTLYAT